MEKQGWLNPKWAAHDEGEGKAKIIDSLTLLLMGSNEFYFSMKVFNGANICTADIKHRRAH